MSATDMRIIIDDLASLVELTTNYHDNPVAKLSLFPFGCLY
jgi:hypothetical protein